MNGNVNGQLDHECIYVDLCKVLADADADRIADADADADGTNADLEVVDAR